MKKMKLIIGLLVAIVLMPSIVFAGGSTSMNVNQNRNTSLNVLVGNVGGNTNTNTNTNTNPIYSVDIQWTGFVFDWTYNSSEGNYSWSNEPVMECEAVTLGRGTVVTSQSGYYRNNSCTSTFSGTVATTGTYYQKQEVGHEIYILDHSNNGYVVPALEWSPTTNYQFTTASFKYASYTCGAINNSYMNEIVNMDGAHYFWTNSSCSGNPVLVTSNNYNSSTTYYGDAGNGFYFEDYSSGYIPMFGRVALGMGADEEHPNGEVGYGYNIEMFLGVDRTKTVRTPVKGESIGSLKIILSTRQ